MFLTIIKTTRWLYKTLNADLFPWQIALGFTLGALAGLMPLGLGTVCVFMAIILVNLHFGSATFAFGLFKLISLPLQGPVIRPLGASALDVAPHGPLIAAAETPVLAWLRLDYYDVAGAIVLWLIIAAPLYLAMLFFWRAWRERLEKKFKKSKFMKWASKVWIFKGFKYVFLGSN